MRNISIKEGGTGRGFTARRLETALEGGGSCLWVPKDDVKRVTKSVDENGTYEAAAEGAYGYSELHVNVKGSGSATGKGPDGNEYTVTVDDLGELTETKVPSSIKITTPPTFVGPYGDGAIISFDGLVVTAYDADGVSMGTVPFEELVFPVKVAKYEKSEESTATSPLIPIPVPYSDSEVRDSYEYNDSTAWGRLVHVDGKITGAKAYAVLLGGRGVIYFISASDNENDNAIHEIRSYYVDDGSQQAPPRVHSLQLNSQYNYDGKTVFYNILEDSHANENKYSYQPAAAEQGTYGEIAWTIIYGIHQGGQDTVTIPVQWPRPGDGKILADTFDIEVVDVSPSTNDDESGNGWTL